MKKFKFSLWSRSKNDSSKPLGKSYRLKNGELITEDVSTNANFVQVVEIGSPDDLEFEMDFNMHDGHAFMTSGLPKDTAITESKVTLKDSPKKDHISRSKHDIEWRDGMGAYYVIDYDSDWSNGKPKTTEELHRDVIRALELGGVDASELQMLAYPSSSSGFIRNSDHHLFDKGGRHLIFLVEDAGDLERFEKALFVYLTLTGSSYGAVSSAGRFLKRGVMDRAAVSPTQPTFAGIPAYRKKGLTNVRGKTLTRRFGRDMLALDTKTVREPTELEMAQYRDFWEAERVRLQPQINRKKREWLAKEGKQLKKHMPNASLEQIRAILEQRWLVQLVGSDTIILDGHHVTISDILKDPDKYDSMTGPDPIEPGYRDGAQTCKVYMNRLNGRPMIYSQAHGGINYRLWYDAQSAMSYLSSMDMSDARASVKSVLRATRVADSTEVDSLLFDFAKLVRIPKKKLIKVYGKKLIKNMQVVSPIMEDLDHTKTNETAQINDISYDAAKRFISTQIAVQCDESQVWIYNGKCWETASDRYLAQALMRILTEQGWEKESGLTRITRDAITSLKEQTHTKTPIIARKPKRILNFQNGEFHFLSAGKVEFKEHDPSSGLTYVLPFDYDPNVEAPIFQQTLEGIFLPPAYERMRKRSNAAQARYEKIYQRNAKIMRKHVEEILAYLLIPDRWIPVWFLWIGDGGNGKTFLTKIINLLLDDSTVESDRLQSITKDSFGLARLIGKTLFIDDDLDINTTIPDGFVKTFSETKSLSANRKFQNPLRFENRCAVLLLTNNYPRMIDVSGGTTRRFHSIVFPRRFYSRQEIQAMVDGPQKDFAEFDQAEPRLIDQIRAELPGVANVLIRAYRRLIKQDGFHLPDAVKKSNDKLLRHSNPLPMFIDSQCDKDVGSKVKTSEFARVLRLWIADQYVKWTPSNLQIRTMMRHSGYQVKIINGYEHYVGIDLKSDIALTADSHADRDDDFEDSENWDDSDDCDANNVARID